MKLRRTGLVAALMTSAVVLLMGISGVAYADVSCTSICYVDAINGDDGNGGASPGDALQTIQAGVDQVADDGEVIVAAGMYSENVSIDHPLTLSGAGIDQTILAGNVNIDISYLTSALVQHLTIQNASYGISVDEGTVNLDYVKIHQSGGAISAYAGDVHVSNSQIVNNASGGTLIKSGVFASTLTIEDSIITGNTAQHLIASDAIYKEGVGHTSILRSLISGNTSSDALLLIVEGVPDVGTLVSGSLSVTDSTVAGNTSSGPLFENASAGQMDLSFSTVEGNHVIGSDLFSNADFLNPRKVGYVNIFNSTISGNEVSGAGINNGPLGEVTIVFSTIADTTISSAALLNNEGQMSFKNSIIANTQGGVNCANYHSFIIMDTVLSSDESCVAFPLFNVDPLLVPLANNGGLTKTHGLFPDSPAIDAAISCTDLAYDTVTVDQRGVARPHGAACDIGAFEWDTPLCVDPDADRDLRNELTYIETPDGVLVQGQIYNASAACTYDVGMASYKMHLAGLFGQELFDSQLGQVDPNEIVEFEVMIDDTCAAQVDLFYGGLIQEFINGLRYGDRLLDALYVRYGDWCGPEVETITVEKRVDWGDSEPDINKTFDICITGPEYPNGDCKTVDYDGGTVVWEDVEAGDYMAWEQYPGDNWQKTPWGEGTSFFILNTYIPPEDDDATTGTDEMTPGDNNGEDNNPQTPPDDTPAPMCDDPDPIRDLRHGGSHLNAPGYSSGVIENLSDACVYQVGIASYQMMDNTTDNQVLFDHAAGIIIGPGESVNLSVSLPGCAAQVDLFYGGLILQFKPGLRYGERLLDGAYVDWGNWCNVAGS